MDLDVEAESGLKTGDEELDPLFLIQAARARKESLKAILVLLDSACALTCCQLAEGVGMKR